MTLIDKVALLNTIATQVHYDTEHPLESYAKLLNLINDAPALNTEPVRQGQTKHKYLYVDPDTDMVVFRENGKILHISADVLVDIYEELMDGSIVRPIRCKDCKWYEIAQLKSDGTDDKRYKPSVCVMGRYAKSRKADWYCADGERREDGNNDRN